MKTKNLIFFLIMVLASLAVFAGSVYAQDIDIDNMDNEQLLILLQQIMDKLNQQETTEPTEEPAAPTEEPAVPTAVPTPEAADPRTKTFKIYENKKLIIGRMPDSYFVQPESNDGNDGGYDFDGDPDPDPRVPDCGPDCSWDLRYGCVCG